MQYEDAYKVEYQDHQTTLVACWQNLPYRACASLEGKLLYHLDQPPRSIYLYQGSKY